MRTNGALLGLVALALAVCIGAANAADAPVAENPQAKGDDCIFSCGVPECAWCGDFIAACPTQLQFEVRSDQQKSNLSFDCLACGEKWLSAQGDEVQLLSATMIDFDQFSEGRSSFVNTKFASFVAVPASDEGNGPSFKVYCFRSRDVAESAREKMGATLLPGWDAAREWLDQQTMLEESNSDLDAQSEN